MSPSVEPITSRIAVGAVELGAAELPLTFASTVLLAMEESATEPLDVIGLGLSVMPAPASISVTVPVPLTDTQLGLAAAPPVVKT